MKIDHLTPVKVVWCDAFDGPSGWTLLTSYKPDSVRPTTVGFLVEDLMDGHLTVCSSFFCGDEGELVISNPIHIPNGMVLSITPLTSK